VKKALVVAYAVSQDGVRQVIGVDLFDVESKATWRAFLKSLMARGLSGVHLVISDGHEGLKQAIGEVFVGTSWQRCRVHFMRNMLGHVGRKDQPALSALLKSIFAQPTKAEAQARLREVAAGLSEKHYKLVALLEEAEDDVLAFMGFPEAHRRQIHSTNVVERLNREIGRRGDVVGIFHFSERRVGVAPHRNGARRARRRVAHVPALLQRGVDGAIARKAGGTAGARREKIGEAVEEGGVKK
jgi:putative transposase